MTKIQKAQQRGQCAYCKRPDLLTKEHIIPRCLFDGVTGGVPDDVPKLLVCSHCNNLKSVDDAYLRDMLVRDVHASGNTIASGIRHGAHTRAIEHGKSQYARDATRLRIALSPNGSGVLMYEPMVPKDRLRGIFMQLVRGLMVAYEHYTLSNDVSFDVLRAVNSTWVLDEAQRWASDMSGMVHTKQVGDGSVFQCVYYHTHSPEESNLSQWWLRFYEQVVYVVTTDMSNLSLGVY